VKVVKHVYIYFLSYFFNAGLSFLTISLLTHYLPNQANDYGIINLYGSFLTLVMPFVSCGVIYPLSVQYYKKDSEAYRQYFTDAQVLTGVSVAFFTLLFLVLRNPLSNFLHVTPIWIIIIPVTVWWIMNNEIMMMMCRMKNLPWKFALFSTGKNLVEILLTIGLVLGLGWAWEGRLLSAALAPVLIGFFSIYLLSRWNFFTNRISWKQIGAISWVSLPFIFERLTVFVLGNSDKYFIDKFDLKGTEQVGLYSVGAQIASIIFLVILSMNSAYQPYLFQSIASGNKGRVKRATGLYILAATVIVGALFIGIPLLFKWFINDRFSGAQVFAYYLSGGYFMWAVYNAFLGYLLFHAKNRLILYISFFGMLFSVLCNFYMVPHYGALGAAITSILTYTFLAVTCMGFAWKYFKS
jgi:O-antigen/teichoic acid export membrane protein